MKRDNIGIHIVSLENGSTLFSLNEKKLFVPASNVKLITSATALKLLEPDFKFKTTLYTDGVRRGETINGNLYLKGSGDPFFVSEEMWLMVKDLKNQGVGLIAGDLVVDGSYFDHQLTANGWGKNPGPQAYNARIGGISFNFNTIAIYVAPSDKVGSPPRVIVDPSTDYIKIINSAKTVKPWSKNRIVVNRIPGEGFDTVTVKGRIAQKKKQQRFFLNVSDPLLYTAKVFRGFLENMGIKVQGKTRFGLVPKAAPILVEHKSKPLSFMIRGLNKYSNNFMAEQTLKTLGAVMAKPPGTFQKGLEQVKNYMEDIGITRGTFVLEDGSGLSRLNRLTPKQIVTILRDVYADVKIRPEYLSSLSIMGVDGSVKKRLKDEVEVHYKTRVKTGTLKGVSALSGYILGKTKGVLAFSILMNYKKGCKPRAAHHLQDNIVKAMVGLE